MPGKSLLCDSGREGNRRLQRRRWASLGNLWRPGGGHTESPNGRPPRGPNPEQSSGLRARGSRFPAPLRSRRQFRGASGGRAAPGGRGPFPAHRPPWGSRLLLGPKDLQSGDINRKFGLPEAKSVLGKNWFKSRLQKGKNFGEWGPRPDPDGL